MCVFFGFSEAIACLRRLKLETLTVYRKFHKKELNGAQFLIFYLCYTQNVCRFLKLTYNPGILKRIKLIEHWTRKKSPMSVCLHIYTSGTAFFSFSWFSV